MKLAALFFPVLICACNAVSGLNDITFYDDSGTDTDTDADTDTDSDTDSDTDTDTDTDSDTDSDTDTDTDTGPEFPATCAEYLLANPGSVDGECTIYVENDGTKPWSVYCHDMSGTPTEYLTLVNTGGDYN